MQSIKYAQKQATKNVFKKKIFFRSFAILKRNEDNRRVIHFFHARNNFIRKNDEDNPFDQPAVELIKKRNKKELLD